MRKALILCTVLASSSLASAEPAPHAESDCAHARKAGKTCVLTIESESVGGQRPTSDSVGVAILTMKSQGSLIHIRRDFVAAIIKTADDL